MHAHACRLFTFAAAVVMDTAAIKDVGVAAIMEVDVAAGAVGGRGHRGYRGRPRPRAPLEAAGGNGGGPFKKAVSEQRREKSASKL